MALIGDVGASAVRPASAPHEARNAALANQASTIQRQGYRASPGRILCVRDDFTAATKRTIAARVAYRCSIPKCGAVTTGPGTAGDESVNLGIAAHISAASPGGPRYDPTLTTEERVSASNGIWACRKCGTLIDSDFAGYSVELLRRWKEAAEKRTREMLAAGVGHLTEGLELAMPSLDSEDSLLSYANTTISRVGRIAELEELMAFLEDDDHPFSWWLWTGPAGVGKSRLALELCRAVSGTWQAGFLRESDQERLGSLVTVTPTLVVVDYAAQRSGWLSDALFKLTQHDPGAPVRVLVLERDARGPWWDVVQCHHHLEEALHLAAARYGLPRALSGLPRADLRKLINEVASRLGHTLSSTNLEDIADHAQRIDQTGSPLFAYMATIDWLSTSGVSVGRDDALRRLVERAESQLARRIEDRASVPRVRNLRFLATTLGGITIDRYESLLQTTQMPPGLLPSMYDSALGVSLDELLDGLRPDILGELLVLERLAAGGVQRAAAQALLQIAWRAGPEAYGAFVRRAAGDHREHENFVDLLSVDGDAPVAWAWLAAATIPLLKRSDHPALPMIFARLAGLQGATGVDEATIDARFRVANLVLGEGEAGRAHQLYTEALAEANPNWPVHASILNNRGITWLELDRRDEAVADFTSVIETGAASNEAQACALNNRADVYEESDLAAAVADRTAVLALAETTYDRRYIALARRARVLWALGDQSSALSDIEAILATDDIAIEQKMEARLQRATLLLEAGDQSQALHDVEAILQSNRNFEDVEARARILLLKPRTTERTS